MAKSLARNHAEAIPLNIYDYDDEEVRGCDSFRGASSLLLVEPRGSFAERTSSAWS
jgi:hypothetical protein